MASWLLVAAGLLWSVVSTLIAWGYATGRLVGSAPTKADLAEARRDTLLAIGRVERRLQGEHDERKRLVEDINVKLGSLLVEQRGLGERQRAIDDDVKELRRKVFNGGAASV